MVVCECGCPLHPGRPPQVEQNCEQVARRVLGLLTAPRQEDPPFPHLTGREREVLDLIAAGLPNRQIVTRLDISAKTASNHVSSIFAKLHLSDRAAAIVRARDAGLGRS